MAKQDLLTFEGTVTEALPNVMFRVKLDVNDIVILCTVCGNMKRNFIKLLEGDKVKVEMSPYDTSRGRISQRLTETKKVTPDERSKYKKK